MTTAAEPKSDTKREILDLAQTLMRENGYNGFSFAHISSQMGIKNAAVHYHFPTKEDLGVAVTHRERRRFQKWIKRTSIDEMDPWEKLDWFFSIYQTYSHDGKRVCYLANLETDFNTIPERLREEARGLNAELLEWLAELMAAGREQGAFDFKGDPADKATVILASIQGGLQIARVTQPERFGATLRQLKNDLGFNG